MIELKNITKYYNKNKRNEVKALDNLSLKIDKGDMIAIMGRSGAGKTTLLNIIGCIESTDCGDYYFEKKQISKLKDKQLAKMRNSKIGIVMQDFALIENETACFNTTIPLYFSKTSLFGMRKKANEALKEMGINDLIDRNVNEMSGGQKQRVAIARALVNNPNVILADEPTGALDTTTTNEILEVLKELNRKGKTIIIVTHDILVARQCNKIIEINDGKVEI